MRFYLFLFTIIYECHSLILSCHLDTLECLKKTIEDLPSLLNGSPNTTGKTCSSCIHNKGVWSKSTASLKINGTGKTLSIEMSVCVTDPYLTTTHGFGFLKQFQIPVIDLNNTTGTFSISPSNIMWNSWLCWCPNFIIQLIVLILFLCCCITYFIWRRRKLNKKSSLTQAVYAYRTFDPSTDYGLSSSFSIEEEAFSQDLLSLHNAIRERHQVPPLKWSESLAQEAKEWCDQLLERNTLEHDLSISEGENLYSCAGPVSASQVVGAWYGQSQVYDFLNVQFRPGTSFFTQMIWRSSIWIGAARSTLNDRSVVVARYSPPGNVWGQYENNVQRGEVN